ncbi:MAG: choice-of-anchor J domain-containing protein, partial [Flavobacterium sp.]|uniref:choice-of-anchor J domain-containing protein n=1 Tax=Flavobacterium sp. TaxID=239 RepID=UPI0022C7DCBD
MKKITLVFILFFCTLFGYSQLAQEGFEGSATTLPTGWNAYHTGSGTTLFAATNSATAICAGSNAAVINRQNIGPGNSSKDYLITKQFSVPANAQVRFTTRQSFQEDLGTVYKVMLSTNADPSILTAYVQLKSYTENEMNPDGYNTCKLQTVDIPTTIATVGQNVHIAFVKEVTATPTTWGERWGLDDISVVSKCLPVSNLTFTNPTATSATLGWTIPAGSTTWNLEYVVLGQGFTGIPNVVGLTAASTGISITGNVVTYILGSLTPNTQYQFSVQNVCAPGNESEWSLPFNFNTLNYGAVCADPIQVTALPYQNSDNTGNFLDLVDVAQGAGCGAAPAA